MTYVPTMVWFSNLFVDFPVLLITLNRFFIAFLNISCTHIFFFNGLTRLHSPFPFCLWYSASNLLPKIINYITIQKFVQGTKFTTVKWLFDGILQNFSLHCYWFFSSSSFRLKFLQCRLLELRQPFIPKRVDSWRVLCISKLWKLNVLNPLSDKDPICPGGLNKYHQICPHDPILSQASRV